VSTLCQSICVWDVELVQSSSGSWDCLAVAFHQGSVEFPFASSQPARRVQRTHLAFLQPSKLPGSSHWIPAWSRWAKLQVSLIFFLLSPMILLA
jgi:hypothetical protein